MQLREEFIGVAMSPITAGYDLLSQRRGRRPVLDLSQASPPGTPAPEVSRYLGALVNCGAAASYTDVPGLQELRADMAEDLAGHYRSHITPGQVTVTAGCNQAFALVIHTLASPGDEVIVQVPYYFSHEMWLRLSGVTPVYLQPDASWIPRAADSANLITPRTRAIVLVTPGNPTGATIPPEELRAFYDLAAANDIALILDETYHEFRPSDEPAHDLFQLPAWGSTLVSLHSLSKSLALPGYRVGAAVCSLEVGGHVEKALDCVAVCAPHIGQEAARAALSAQQWRAEQRHMITERRRRFREIMQPQPGGFVLQSCGGYFGWVKHPWPQRPTADVLTDLVTQQDLLVMPGTAFMPDDRGMLRFSVGNLATEECSDLAERLSEAGAHRTER